MARIKKRYIIIIAVAAVALIFTVSILRKPGAVDADGGEGARGTPVEICDVKKGDIASVATISGKLEALYRANVVAKATGSVKGIPAQVGQRVNSGDTLLIIDDADIKVQLDQARAGLSMAEANFIQNKERYENAKKDLRRGEALFEEGAISEQVLEQMRAAASDAGLNVLEAQLKQAKASYELMLKQYEECHVKSPIGGVVAYINVGVGETVSPGMSVAVVVDMSSVILEGTVGEGLINYIDKQKNVDVRIPSVKDGYFTGIVNELSPAADQRTGLFGLKVLVDNPGEAIKPGMFAEASLIKDLKENVLYIPQRAVLTKNGGKFVYTVEHEKATLKEVITGIIGDDVIEVISGIAQGEAVVVRGQDYLNDGDAVRTVRGDDQ